MTSLGNKRYTPDIIERTDPRGRKYYWIGTGTFRITTARKAATSGRCRTGLISLSIIKYDLNSKQEQDRLARPSAVLFPASIQACDPVAG